ncbi:MAG: cytochrome c oxidase subunit II [Pseudomonadota bacterium]
MGVNASVSADTRYNMTEGVTDISKSVFQMHQNALYIVIGIGVVVFGAMFYSIYAHRKSKNPTPAQFHESTTIEIIWTIIPFILLMFLAVPATSTLIKMYDTSDADITIKITGWQWKWHYDYLDEEIEFFSNLSTSQQKIRAKLDGGEALSYQELGENYLLEVDNELVLPINKKIRFLVTAEDVIHSWWVPDFAIKRDAIPGFINEAWTKINEPGTYRGQCTELCGKDHGFMPVVVKAVTEEEYVQWLADKKQEKIEAAEAARLAALQSWDKTKLMTLGQSVYEAKCAMCHGVNGEGGIGNAITGSVVTNGPTDAHIDIVFNGKAGSAMQAFKAQLTSAEIAAVLTYQRNALGNNVGDLIQPADIEKLR